MGNRRQENGWSHAEEEQDEPSPFIKNIFDGDLRLRDELTRYIERMQKTDAELGEKMFPFQTTFVKQLLHNMHIVFMGDSLTRAIYKDLVGLLQNDNILHWKFLKLKSESSHMNDRQIDCLSLDSDRIFRQAREYMTKEHLLQYFFTTRVMKGDVDKALLQMHRSNEFPDVLVLNSALWDLTRYHRNEVDMRHVQPYEDNPKQQIDNEQDAMEEYLERLAILMRRLRVILPPTTQVIWLCMPWPLPNGQNALTARTDTAKTRMLHRSMYCDGNYRAAQVVAAAGYDVLDLGFYFRNHSLYAFRVPDGVHWDAVGTRMMTQLLIGHLAKNLGDALPAEVQQKIDAMEVDVGNPNDRTGFGAAYLNSINSCALRSGQIIRHTGSYSLALQRDLNEKSFEMIPEQIRKAIEEDIETLRMSEIIRLRQLEVSEQDEAAIQERVKKFPKILNLLTTKDFKPQRLILRPMPAAASSSKK